MHRLIKVINAHNDNVNFNICETAHQALFANISSVCQLNIWFVLCVSLLFYASLKYILCIFSYKLKKKNGLKSTYKILDAFVWFCSLLNDEKFARNVFFFPNSASMRYTHKKAIHERTYNFKNQIWNLLRRIFLFITPSKSELQANLTISVETRD